MSAMQPRTRPRRPGRLIADDFRAGIAPPHGKSADSRRAGIIGLARNVEAAAKGEHQLF